MIEYIAVIRVKDDSKPESRSVEVIRDIVESLDTPPGVRFEIIVFGRLESGEN
jgi:hypothetical protein